MDIRKNEKNKSVVIDLNDDGQGVVKTKDNQVIFIPNALPGEEVEFQVIQAKSKFAIAKALSIANTSSDRVSPPCPYFNKCGGCDIQHLSKNCQLKFKSNIVQNAFKKICGIEMEIPLCIGLNDYRYRNKIALPVSQLGEVGLFRKNSHNIIPIHDCIITETWNKDVIDAVCTYIKKTNISCYDENTKTGILKHVVARQIGNKILITLVVTQNNLPQQNTLIDELSKKFLDFGLNININTLNNNVILSQNWKHIYGIKELTASEYGINYPVSNASFYQVNNDIKTAIYDACLNNISDQDVVVDAYSGAGLLSAIISKKAKKCYGIEIIPQATQNANELKKNNNLQNLENINGDCAKELPKLVKTLTENYCVVLDPPRKGCDETVLKAIIDSNPKKIIYISCNPSTLARDAKLLLESNKFKIKSVQPYDMFPQTSHVETLAVFEQI